MYLDLVLNPRKKSEYKILCILKKKILQYSLVYIKTTMCFRLSEDYNVLSST